MTTGGAGRRPPSVVLTLLKVGAILLAIVVLARLVPLAIRAIGAAGRGGAQVVSGAGLWGIAGTVLLVVALILLVRHRSGRRGPPRSRPN